MTLAQACFLSLMVLSTMATDEDTLLQAKLATAAQDDEDTDSIDVSFIQQKKSLSDATSMAYFAEQLKRFKQQPSMVNPTVNQTMHFISVNGLMCVDGPARTVAGGLALIKAGLHGLLWNNFLGGKPGDCASRYFTFSAGEHKSYPGLQTYSFNNFTAAVFEFREKQALSDFRQTYNLTSDDYTQMLHVCTSHPQSHNVLNYGRDINCTAATASQPGAWVHHDLDGIELICNEGPFQDSTFALAVLKSTAQVRMHPRDQIAATSCAALGFPVLFPPKCHCFTGNHMWTRTAIGGDVGVQLSTATENLIFNQTSTMNWYAFNGLDAGMSSILYSSPGCHCAPTSSVGLQMNAESGGCAASHPPIRDWLERPYNVAMLSGYGS